MYVPYDKLTLPERELCQMLLRDIAERMLSTLSDDTRSIIGVDELTIYDLSNTSFEQAFTVLENAGLLKPVYPNFFPDNRKKRVSPYGRLMAPIDDIPGRLEKNAPDNRPFLEEIIDAYVSLFCGYDDLSTARNWFTAPAKLQRATAMLQKNGYVTENGGEYRWTDKIALSMWRSQCWDTDADTDTERRLLNPLIEELTTNIPDYVRKTIHLELTKEKAFKARRKIQTLNFRVVFERVLILHYRFETWMPQDQAKRYPYPKYWNGVTMKLSRVFAAMYAPE